MSKQTQFSAQVPTEEYETFRKNFPQYGATTWLINTILADFNRLCEDLPASKDIISKAIAQTVADNRYAMAEAIEEPEPRVVFGAEGEYGRDV